jgi:2-polyprenyl-6-methoxyphenol hydroxylase-like FAD-dependent oxidoreductase
VIDTDVLIVGAGPTGLVLALWLTRLGVRVRIVDRAPEPGTTSRAVAVQARTLELYRAIDLADALVSRGRRAAAANMWVAGRHVARAVFGDLGKGLSPYPYALIFPQDEHERLLTDRLAQAGVVVERPTELVDVDFSGRVRARLQRAGGAVETCDAAYLAGCDGAHSTARDALRVGFPGGTYEHLFYVADVDAAGAVANGEIHVALDATDFLALFPLSGERRLRLVGTIRDEAERRHDDLTWEDVSPRVIAWMPIRIERVNWFSTYRVHHRVADRFRDGRAFLLGDAAHIHSPVGGQGMNTGIGDAVNLAWKLAAVRYGAADASILDTYETERIAFARRLVSTTDRAFTGVTSSTVLARAIRLHLVPWLMPSLFAFDAVKRLLFRTISQTAIEYRASALSEGRAGEVQGGDRLPWVQLTADGADNFAPLSSIDWQVHVYGDAAPDLRAVCQERGLALHAFPWQPAMQRAGLQRDAVYLVRPDGYVGLAADERATAALASYLDTRALRPLAR